MAGLFGWIGVGALVGERLLRALNAREIAPLWAAGLGTLLTTSISVGLSVALCLAPFGWLLFFVLGCLGLGAVVLTRFGTTRYIPHRPTPPSLAPVKVPDPPDPLEEASRSGETEGA